MDGWFLAVLGEYMHRSYENKVTRKYHYFEDNVSFCDKYAMNTNYFKTNINSGEILKAPQFACKKCYAKWKKEFDIQ